MKAKCDLLFTYGNGYDELVELIRGNTRFVFHVVDEAKLDRRRVTSRYKGWVKLAHKSQSKDGYVRLEKKSGRCLMHVVDKSAGQLTGAWLSWLMRNASDLVYGIDVRFAD